MSKMFPFVTKTWNPITGCLHGCKYCWAHSLNELYRRFRSGDFVFVTDMGDLFGKWVDVEWIIKVFRVIKAHPEATFLLLTKNPQRYLGLERVTPDGYLAHFAPRPAQVVRRRGWGWLLRIEFWHDGAEAIWRKIFHQNIEKVESVVPCQADDQLCGGEAP